MHAILFGPDRWQHMTFVMGNWKNNSSEYSTSIKKNQRSTGLLAPPITGIATSLSLTFSNELVLTPEESYIARLLGCFVLVP